ncbi:PTS sugar transporter subunit IIA, partial [Salmonella enterica]|nr:PTS sugar transporter subunit IIA [Salmonella enterica]
PGIALPHARPEQGANHNQISVTTLSTPVAFGNADCDPIWLLLCAAHIRTIQRISQWLDSPESVAMLQDAPNDAALFAQLTALR